jgi:CheY-like chemotaxis protein
MSLAASERKSKLSVTVAAGVPAKLMGDRSRLQQLIIHLLSSSLSNTEASTITVAVLDLSRGRIGFLVHNLDASESQTIATSVFKEGNGSGLVPRSRSSVSSEKTLGILAAKMGGQLGKHILGNGKPAFWLTCQLPADNTPPPLSVAASTKSVLVVEDIAYNASATQAILAKLGFTADIAVDGPSALARLKAHRYDLVFMDGNLPGMSGVDVTVQYRATEGANHHAIIIATTSDSSTANREACAQAGMDAFIAKPITPEKVSLVLREHQRQTEENAGTSTPIYIEADKSADAPDLSLLQFLSDVANGGLRTQIDRYLTNLEIDRQRAHDIATSGDTKHLSQVAHRLVSHADALRYEPLRSVAVSIHAEAAIIDPTTLQDRLRRFDQAFQGLTKKLESIRASTAPS